MKLLRPYLLILVPFLTFIIGVILPIDIFPPQITAFKETRNPGSYHFINPLLECDQANFSTDHNLNHIKDDLQALIDQYLAKNSLTAASVYYRNLNNGPWFGINETALFSPASLIKVPLLITYLKQADTDPSILQQKLLYQKQPDIPQDIEPEITLTDNQSYSIDDLLHQMIVYSDNQAYNVLFNHINNQQLVNTYRDLGIDLSRAFVDPNGNIISVKDYASFYRILYNSSYLSKTMSEKALKLLSQTTFKDGLDKQLPPSLITSHKYGERFYQSTGEKQLHDCGIVYVPGNPYLVCIMTRGTDFTQLETVIQNLSATIYQNLNK